MLLAVDVGNTQTHIGVFDGEKLQHEWRAATDPTRTADELALLFREFLTFGDVSFSKQIKGVAICSVVPRVTQNLRQMTLQSFGFSATVVEPGIKTGLAVLTDNPKEVGADRIANAVAAREMFAEEAIVVVDFGTAITVDVLSANGEYLGGAIAPGFEISSTALFSATAQLRRVELKEAPASAIGKSTVASVQSGILYGTAGLVDGLVDRVLDELGEDARVIATGGLASVVYKHCRTIERIEPTLTLQGLRLIFDRNN